MRTVFGDKHDGPPPSNPAQTRDDNVGVEPNGTMSSDRHENTVVQNRADEEEGAHVESEVPRQIPLTATQKQILLSCGFRQDELDRMRFLTTTEAYDWCGVQMRSPKKRSPSQQNNDVASPSEKRIRLTRAQKDVLRSFGHSTEELESMRFYTVQEGFNWVGSMINGFFAPCYDYGDEYWDPDDGAYSLEEEDFEEEYDDDDDQEEESSEGEESSEEGDEEEGDEEEGDMSPDGTLVLQNTLTQPTSIDSGNHVMIKQEEEEEEEEGMETCNGVVPKRERDMQYMCEICFEPMGHDTDRQMASAKCGHVYCRSCLVGIASDKRTCPSCGKGVHAASIRNIYIP
mmetsp:Transcript_6390/g.12604  ORF Transcript_6390/g.12604 Transcript_6390/m.12604 type:complete len:343 (+) Transcript_6390:49-1077(+)